MGLSQRNCALLLVVVTAVCIELYQAQPFFGRCTCINGVARNIRGNITDFILNEKKPGCNSRELIVTVTRPDNSTFQRCLNLQAERARDLIRCWESINKDQNKKMECINNRKKKVDDRTSAESST